jgi:arabinan endo-1,5-alpha-L-arabinosidase
MIGARRAITLCLLAAASCWSAAFALQVEVHDPAMARQGDDYYVFSTGPGITIYRSSDLEHWQWIGRVFETEPDWARQTVPDFNRHLWAPDVFEKNGRYYLYYSVSAFGKNTSVIGVAVSETLDPDSPDYRWVDQGPVLQSVPHRDHWNAIDPAIVENEDGTPWMSFGSFWEGIKLVRLDASLVRLAEPQEWHSLAKRPRSPGLPDDDPGDGAIEAPYIFRKDGWYYLFVSFDKCCRGMDSTYKIMVGRSKSVTGPYVDRAGTPMLAGGGSLVLEGTDEWVALGHCAAYTFDGEDWLVFHAYETADGGKQKLRILPIGWEDGWPAVDPDDLNRLGTELEGTGPPENEAEERP